MALSSPARYSEVAVFRVKVDMTRTWIASSIVIIACFIPALAGWAENSWTEEAQRCFAIADDPELGIEACTQAINKGGLSDEDLAVTYSNRAISYQDMDNYKAALKDMDAAIDLMPDDPGHLSNRSTVLIDMKRYTDALETLNAALDIDPFDPYALNNRCWVLALTIKYQEALLDCDMALEGNEFDAFAFATRSYVFTKMGDFDKALEDGNASVLYAPDIWESNFYRGLVHLARGERDAAVTDFKRAYDIAPHVREVKEKLREVGLLKE